MDKNKKKFQMNSSNEKNIKKLEIDIEKTNVNYKHIWIRKRRIYFIRCKIYWNRINSFSLIRTNESEKSYFVVAFWFTSRIVVDVSQWTKNIRKHWTISFRTNIFIFLISSLRFYIYVLYIHIMKKIMKAI